MIEALKSEEIVDRMGGRFRLCALIQRRMKQLIDGARPLVDRDGRTDLEVVVQEILEGKVQIGMEAASALPGGGEEEPLL